MPRGDKSSYTDKQKRQAHHIEQSYEQRGVNEKEAERRAWATVNKETGGGKKSGSGRGHGVTPEHSPKSRKKSADASAYHPTEGPPASTQKGAKTRKSK